MNKEGKIIIRDHVSLQKRIMELNYKRAEQEVVIKNDLKELYYSLQPAEIIRNAMKKISGDTDVQFKIARAGIGTGLNYLIGRLTGRSNTLKGFVSSMLLEKVTTLALNRYSDKIVNIAGSLKNFFKKAA